MARGRARVTGAEKAVGFGVLAVLGVITVWLLVRQAQFNPAVVASLRQAEAPAAPAAAPQALTETSAPLLTLDGFTPLGPTETFDPETLSDKIDGKAELYIASNFKEMSCRTFGAAGQGSQARIEAYVYAMGDPRDAYAVLSGQRRPDAMESPLGRNAYATENALFLTRGRFYLELVADRGSAEIGPALQAAAAAILAGLPAEAQSAEQAQAADETGLFPEQGLDKDSVRLTVSDVFGMEGLSNIYTADYRLDQGDATAFLSGRASAEEASRTAEAYIGFLASNGYKESPAQGTPDGARVFTLDNSTEVVMVRDKMLAGVHDASSPQAAMELAGRLAAKLTGASK